MNPESSEPKVENKPIPLWIKVMWFFGVIWVLTYIIWGLQKGPTTW